MQYSEEKKYYLGDKDELTAREKARCPVEVSGLVSLDAT